MQRSLSHIGSSNNVLSEVVKEAELNRNLRSLIDGPNRSNSYSPDSYSTVPSVCSSQYSQPTSPIIG